MLKKIIVPILVFALLLQVTIADTTSDIWDDALIVWNSDINTTFDNSSNYFQGRVAGDPTHDTVTPHVGEGSTSFDGNDKVIFDNNDVLASSRNFSVFGWVKMPNTGAIEAIAMMDDDLGSGKAGSWGIIIDDRPGDPTMRCPAESGAGEAPQTIRGLDDDNWQHIGCVFNQTDPTSFRVTFYNNGTWIGTYTKTNTLQAPTMDFTLGGRNDTDTWGLNGELDEWVYINRSLSHDEIIHLYNLGVNNSSLGGSEAPPVDVTPPSVTITSPNNNSAQDSIVILYNLTIVEPSLDTIKIDFNGTDELDGFNNDFGNVWTKSKVVTAEGLYFTQIFVNDTSGNSFTSDVIYVTVDNTTPEITYNSPSEQNDSFINPNSGTVNINGFNLNLNLANLSVFAPNTSVIYQNVTVISTNSFTFFDTYIQIFDGNPDDVYTVSACFRDIANLTTCEEHDLTVDTTAPAIASFSLSNSTPNDGDSITYTSSCTDANNIGFFEIELNESGSFVQVASESGSLNSPYTYYHNDTAIEGFVSARFDCSDFANNSVTSGLVNYTGGSAPVIPAVASSLPLEGIANIGAMAGLLLIIYGAVRFA